MNPYSRLSGSSLEHATYWALRSQKQRRRRKHKLSNAEIAHLFGSEWGLDAVDRSELFVRIMGAPAVKR